METIDSTAENFVEKHNKAVSILDAAAKGKYGIPAVVVV